MSGRVPSELFNKIKEKSKLEKTAIYKTIAKKRYESGGLISERAAAVQVAADLGITSAFKYLTNEDREILVRLRMPQATDTPARVRVVQRDRAVAIDSLRGVSAIEPYLPPFLIEEATQMAEKCYPLLYIYENTIRNVIRVLMEKEYGSDWWNLRFKPLHGARDAVIESRIKVEGDERWHSSRRGVHKICYTDLDDLKMIIEDNWPVFKKIHPRKSWVVEHILQPNHSRNIIAHNNPLSKRDIISINTKILEWLDQIKGIAS
jgi:hypothetical protein